MMLAQRLSLVLALAGVALAGLAIAAAGWLLVGASLQPEERLLVEPIIAAKLPLFVIATVFALAFCLMAARAAHRRYVELPWRLVEDIRVLVAHSDGRLEPYGFAALKAIADGVNELAAERQALETDVGLRIAAANRTVEEERNRLAALMSELRQSVVVCNLDGRILLYNESARALFLGPSQAPAAAGVGEILGLGRSIYTVFDPQLIAHAMENIASRRRPEDEKAATNFVTTTRSGQLLRVHMTAVAGASPGAGEATAPASITGYVLLLDNITTLFEQESKRDALLQSLSEGNRSALAGVRAAVETLIDVPDMEARQRERFLAVIHDETARMSQRVEQSTSEFVGALKARWPLEEMRGSDLLAAAARRIDLAAGLPVRIEASDESVWLKVDSFSFLQLLTYLAARLAEDRAVREIRFRLSREGTLAHLDLCWLGASMNTETAMGWELDQMQISDKDGGREVSPLTAREVLDRCGGEMWLQRERASHLSFFRIVLPAAAVRSTLAADTNGDHKGGAVALVRAQSRPNYYDFDLFNYAGRGHALDERKLSELAFTVFDTETTGLEPSNGDEIIQIGATRILNSKLLLHENFDRLIDPRRKLPAASTAIHGITAEMLRGQPGIAEVLPSFHAFAEDTVLVAHNAAFDMRFLQLKEKLTGLSFKHPVLDTLLLSAVLHPNQESHSLEAISQRFGIPIIGRHTALGDAIVTGEVFLRMIPLLAEQGIVTLRQAIDASQATALAKIGY